MSEKTISTFHLRLWRFISALLAIGIALVAVHFEFGPQKWSIHENLPKNITFSQEFRFNKSSQDWKQWQWEHFFTRQKLAITSLSQEQFPELPGNYSITPNLKQSSFTIHLTCQRVSSDLFNAFNSITNAYSEQYNQKLAKIKTVNSDSRVNSNNETDQTNIKITDNSTDSQSAKSSTQIAKRIGKIISRKGTLAQQVAALGEEFKQEESAEDIEVKRAVQVERGIESWIKMKKRHCTAKQWSINSLQKEYAGLISRVVVEKQKLSEVRLTNNSSKSDHIRSQIKTIERRKNEIQRGISQYNQEIENTNNQISFLNSFLFNQSLKATLPSETDSRVKTISPDDIEDIVNQHSDEHKQAHIPNFSPKTAISRTNETPADTLPALIKPISPIASDSQLNLQGYIALYLLAFFAGSIGYLLCPVQLLNRNTTNKASKTIEPMGEPEEIVDNEQESNSWDPHYDQLAQKVIELHKDRSGDKSQPGGLMVLVSALQEDDMSPRALVDLAISLVRQKLQVLVVEVERNCNDLTAIITDDDQHTDPESQTLPDFTHWVENKVDLSEVVVTAALEGLYFIPGGRIAEGSSGEQVMAESLLSDAELPQKEDIDARLALLRGFFDVILLYSPATLPALTQTPPPETCPTVQWLPDIADGLIAQIFSSRKSRKTGRKTSLQIASLVEELKASYLGLSYWKD